MLDVDTREVVAWLRRLVYLDTTVFEDVRSIPTATIPSVAIVTAATFIAGFGGWLWWSVEKLGDSTDILIHSAILGSLIAIALWGIAWLGIVYVMLTQVFRERAYVEQLLRVMGLAAAPLALMGLMLIPGLSLGIGVAALALTFAMTGIAISSVTTANQGQVLAANLLGFFVWAVSSMAAGEIAAFMNSPYGVIADVKMLNFFRHLGQTGAIRVEQEFAHHNSPAGVEGGENFSDQRRAPLRRFAHHHAEQQRHLVAAPQIICLKIALLHAHAVGEAIVGDDFTRHRYDARKLKHGGGEVRIVPGQREAVAAVPAAHV